MGVAATRGSARPGRAPAGPFLRPRLHRRACFGPPARAGRGCSAALDASRAGARATGRRGVRSRERAGLGMRLRRGLAWTGRGGCVPSGHLSAIHAVFCGSGAKSSAEVGNVYLAAEAITVFVVPSAPGVKPKPSKMKLTSPQIRNRRRTTNKADLFTRSRWSTGRSPPASGAPRKFSFSPLTRRSPPEPPVKNAKVKLLLSPILATPEVFETGSPHDSLGCKTSLLHERLEWPLRLASSDR